MSFNGSGTFQINSAGQPVVAGTVITASAFNALTADLATGLSTCMTKDGQTSATANIPMGNNKFTGLSAGTAATDSANLGQVQGNVASLISVAGIDTITGSMSPTLTAYSTGAMYWFVAAGTNTGAVTLNIDGLGAKSVTRDGSTALIAGDIVNGQVAVVVYDGTRFQLQKANAFGTLTATTINTTNLTATGTVNLTGATVSNGGSVTTIDINGGTVDGVTIGGASAGAGTFTNLTASGTINFTGATVSNGGSVTTVDINGGTIDGAIIGGASAAAGTFTTATVGAGLVGTPSLTTTGDTNTGLYFPAADTIAVATSGTERIRIDSSGNVGIGTSSPGATLNVVAATASDAVRITQTGTGNALVVEDSTNPDATPFVVEANGRLIVGSTSTQPSLGATNIPQIGVFGNSTSNNGFANYSYTLSQSASFFNFAKSRSTTPGSFAILSDGDDLGYVKFNGDDGTQFVEAARIWAEVDGTPGTNDMPGRLIFSTTPDGASTPTERMRIDSSGNVGIGTSSPNVLLNLAGSSTTALARIANTGSGASAFDGSGAGLELIAGAMNSGANKYAPAIKFGSTDSDFTTTNPKFGAALVATAVQTYSSDTTGGMNLEFWTAPANPGTGSGLVQNMTLTSAGRLGIGTAAPACLLDVTGGIQTSRTTVTSPATTDGNIFSGSYTPTLTNTTNITSSTASALYYTRVGNVVAVFGRVNITATATGDTLIGISLPIASALTTNGQVAGMGSLASSTVANNTFGRINADATNDRAQFQLNSTLTTDQTYSINFTYVVL